MGTVTIQYAELDDDNVPHVTRHDVTLTEVDPAVHRDEPQTQQQAQRGR